MLYLETQRKTPNVGDMHINGFPKVLMPEDAMKQQSKRLMEDDDIEGVDTQ